MSNQWLVIGLSGVTSGGKSTLVNQLLRLYPDSKFLCMDKCFKSPSDSSHKKVVGLDHNNWERLGAIDLTEWHNQIETILKCSPETCSVTTNQFANFNLCDEIIEPSVGVPDLRGKTILILDGFLALNDDWTASRCDLKFYMTLTKEECFRRRQLRNYNPPDPEGYFELCVWPEHVKMKQNMIDNNKDAILLDGAQPKNKLLDTILTKIQEKC